MRLLTYITVPIALIATSPAFAVVSLTGPSVENPLALPSSRAVSGRLRDLGNGGGAAVFTGTNPGNGPCGGLYNCGGATFNYAASNSFGFSFAGETATTSISNGSGAVSVSFTGISGPLNTLAISLIDRSSVSSFTLSNIVFTNSASETFLGTISSPAASGSSYFTVAGVNFADGFTLTGDLNLSGAFSTSAELNRVDFALGNTVPEPGAWAMLILGFGLVGAAMRRRQTVAA